ncbi:MAG TPA: CBS domain-containing protein [Rhodospirillales bacterium]|nr:CBS domain-containing protein [Rhodospirillales bacterium]
MIVRNWMQENPTIIGGDTLVVEAKRILSEGSLRALPVVDDGRLRGVVTRAHCLRAAEAITRNQDPHEIDYFVNRLKVKDIMVRNPETVEVGDTMAYTLFKGQDKGVSQFPVMDDNAVVGIVSAAEIFYLSAQLLGAWENWCGITLDNVAVGKGTLAEIAVFVESQGATLHAIYQLAKQDTREKRVVMRLDSKDMDAIVAALIEAGYHVVESSTNVRGSRS